MRITTKYLNVEHTTVYKEGIADNLKISTCYVNLYKLIKMYFVSLYTALVNVSELFFSDFVIE